MISLFTGVPGSGKTNMIITQIFDIIEKDPRPLFVHGVPELKIDHTPVVCRFPKCKVCPPKMEDRENFLFADQWNEWAPENALIFFDEVQNIYRPRHPSSKMPESVMAFETHRHDAQDFILASQSAKLFDPAIREHVAKHVHLVSTWAKRISYEWGEAQLDTKRYTSAVKKPYKLNKKVYWAYRSAVAHTEVKRTIPPAAFIFTGLLLAIVVGVYLLYSSYQNKFNKEPVSQSSEVGVIGEASAEPITPTKQYSNNLDFTPTLYGVPSSAPAYAHLVQVKDFPRIAACMLNESTGTCVCYSQQITIIDIDYKTCIDQVNNKYFNPFVEPDKEKTASIKQSSGNITE